MSPASYAVTAVAGLPEVRAGDDLAALIAAAVDLRSGDVLAVSSKVVSKAEGLLVDLPRESVVDEQTARVVARRGDTTIARTRHGLVMAAAGVDASNVPPGTALPLPEDPDESARRLRSSLLDLTGACVGVVVTDTSGRAWRTGQTDIAIGVAGIAPLHDLAGLTDPHGHPLRVTAPAVADEIAAAADLVKGKLGATPVAVVRGLDDLVLPADDDGPGARALVRPESEDMFGYGAREAVLRAVLADDEGRGFGSPVSADEVAVAVGRIPHAVAEVRSADRVSLLRTAGSPPDAALVSLADVVARAHGWLPVHDSDDPAMRTWRADRPVAGSP